MTRALITGATGFVGRHLWELLEGAGWVVAGVARSPVSLVPNSPLTSRISADVCDLPAMTEVFEDIRPEVVFHLAAIVDTVETPDVLALHRTNVFGTATVLEAARRVGCVSRIMMASSSFAYGRVDREGPISELVSLRPLTAYGSSKVAAEAIALQWCRETGTDVVVSRAFQHTGPGHVGAYALADWANQLATGAENIRVGNLDVFRDYLDVRDVAAAYMELSLTGLAARVYNVGSGRPISMRSLLEGLISAFGVHASIFMDPHRVRGGEQPCFYANVERIHRETSWNPQYSISETLHDLAKSRWNVRDSDSVGRAR